MKIESTITIQAPHEKVFEVFTDLNELATRIDGITSIEIIKQPAHMQVGTTWKETRLLFGKKATETMWVTELLPNQNYVVEAESHGTKYRTEYTFTQTAESVHVTMVFEGIPLTFGARLMGFMFFFFSSSMKKMLHQDMLDLKKVCEEPVST